MPRIWALLFLALAVGKFTLPKVLPVAPSQTNLCAVIWAQGTNGILSDPTNVCILIGSNTNTAIAWWDPVLTGPKVTNYVLGWSRSPITNLVPGPNIQWTNTGLATTQSFFIVPPVTMYELIFLQGSSNLVDFYDLSATPYLRLTNGGSIPIQFFRSRTEWTTNWR